MAAHDHMDYTLGCNITRYDKAHFGIPDRTFKKSRHIYGFWGHY